MLFENPFDKVIKSALKEMETIPASSEEYTNIARNIAMLADAKAKAHNVRMDIDPNEVLKIVATGVLVFATLHFEETGCLTTKATMWLRKLW